MLALCHPFIEFCYNLSIDQQTRRGTRCSVSCRLAASVVKDANMDFMLHHKNFSWVLVRTMLFIFPERKVYLSHKDLMCNLLNWLQLS